MSTALRIDCVTGPAILPHLEAVARLRIEIFRDFPYLYDGSLDYESDYLATYSACAQSLFVLAYANDEIIGVATGIPLASETAAIRQPFQQIGLAPERVFYFGESVLLPSFRGRGFGHRFFEAREDYARALGMAFTAFCAVDRASDHPLRPAHYRSLDRFWQQRGYQRHSELRARMKWKDIDQPAETEKSMVFWLRALAGSS